MPFKFEYPGFVIEGFIPFDPIEIAEATKEIVCTNSKRKYTFGSRIRGYL